METEVFGKLKRLHSYALLKSIERKRHEGGARRQKIERNKDIHI